MNILSTNARDLKHKHEDLKNKVKFFQSGIFTIQETHYRTKGKFKMDNYTIFEAIRKNKEHGGSMIGVHVGLKPVLVKDYDEQFELIVVEIKIGNKSIRVITGYGPQEIWKPSEKMDFYVALEKEIASAELAGKSYIIAMDANAKLGPTYIPGDPHPISQNGKLLSGIIERHAICVANGLVEKRQGIITREIHTINGIEKSVIDLVLLSGDLIKHMEYIHVDDKREYVLTNIVKTKKGKEHTKSDHNITNTKFNLAWTHTEQEQMTTFKDNDNEAKKNFKQQTTKTHELTKIVDMQKPIDSDKQTN